MLLMFVRESTDALEVLWMLVCLADCYFQIMKIYHLVIFALLNFGQAIFNLAKLGTIVPVKYHVNGK